MNISEGYVLIETEKGTEQLPADAIIVSTGSAPVRDLAQSVYSKPIDTLIIGDADGIGKISDAVQRGFDMALLV